MNREVVDKTNGQVRFKIYPGGVQGDEKDVLRKIRSGQLHGGAFTGLGMGALFPDTLVVAVPTLVRTYEEVDLIKRELGDYFTEGIERNGFVLLGWQEVGFVYLLSTKPITTADDLRQSRIWAWEGDQVAPAVFKEGKIMPVYLAIQDVLPALQTGLIDSAYSSPFGAVALQWHTKVKYMADMPLTYALSGLAVTKKQFQKIPPRLQAVVKEVCARHLQTLVVKTRDANRKAVDTLKKQGIQVLSFTPEAVAELRDVFGRAGEKLSGTVFSEAIFGRLKKLLADHRASKGDRR